MSNIATVLNDIEDLISNENDDEVIALLEAAADSLSDAIILKKEAAEEKNEGEDEDA